MNALFGCIALECSIFGLDIDLTQTVESNDVKLVHRLVVLGGISSAYDNPVIGYAMPPERLELQELQHRRIERFRNAINLVKE